MIDTTVIKDIANELQEALTRNQARKLLHGYNKGDLLKIAKESEIFVKNNLSIDMIIDRLVESTIGANIKCKILSGLNIFNIKDILVAEKKVGNINFLTNEYDKEGNKLDRIYFCNRNMVKELYNIYGENFNYIADSVTLYLVNKGDSHDFKACYFNNDEDISGYTTLEQNISSEKVIDILFSIK